VKHCFLHTAVISSSPFNELETAISGDTEHRCSGDTGAAMA
jgi:hypothetical protein